MNLMQEMRGYEEFEVGEIVIVHPGIQQPYKSEVTEITKSGNIRVKGIEGLFDKLGYQRSKSLFWSDNYSISHITD